MRTNLKQTIGIIIKMEISLKRKDKLTVVLKSEGVKSFIVISVALNMGFKCNCESVCCENDENCRGGTLFFVVVAVVVVFATENRISIKYS